MGYKDGRSGISADIINTYAVSCAKHGASPDPEAYTAGYQSGIALYCTPDNGYEQGRRIQDYAGSCPVELEKPFIEKYLHGLRVTDQALKFDFDRERFELDVLRDRRDRKLRPMNCMPTSINESGKPEMYCAQLSKNATLSAKRLNDGSSTPIKSGQFRQ